MQQAVQRRFVLLFEESDHFALSRLGDCILLAVAMLEPARLRLEGFQLCNSKATEARRCSRCEIVLPAALVEGLLHVVATNEGVVHAHQVNVRFSVYSLGKWYPQKKLRKSLDKGLKKA